MYPSIMFPVAILILFVSTVHTATIAQVEASNSALTSQADTVDTAVVAITAQTPLTTAQQIPTSLQSLTNAISSALSASIPTTPTTDPATEATVVRSWGLFANTISELMADYIEQRANLIGVFGLKSAIYTQLLTFNTTFQDYADFMVGLVSDTAYKINITNTTHEATDYYHHNLNGVYDAIADYAP